MVGLVQGPTLYNPWRNPEAAKPRRDVVLNNMMVMGYLSETEYQDETTSFKCGGVNQLLGPAKFPDFLDIVRRHYVQNIKKVILPIKA